MADENPDLIKKLSTLNKDSKKKTAADFEEMKETVAAILAQDEVLERFLQNLSKEKWNPKTLEMFSEGINKRLNDRPQEDTAENILAILQANHRGVWLPGMVKGLSALLARREGKAFRFLKEILTKTRKSRSGDPWSFYEKYFINHLKPNQGLPYILWLFLESWPEGPLPQIEVILKKLADIYAKDRAPSFSPETRAALEEYLARRCDRLNLPFRDVEFHLLKMVALQRVPEWQENLTQIAERLREAQAKEEVTWATFLLKQLASQVHDQGAELSTSPPFPDLLQKTIISPVETILAKKEVFLSELESFLRKHEELQATYSQTAHRLEEMQKEVTHLKDILRRRDQTIAGHKSSLKSLHQERADLSRQNAKLKDEVDHMKAEIRGEKHRSDVRAHQINLEAERKILQFKDTLWRRLSPDLEDFLGGELKEEDYATPDRGRRLYRRVIDLIRILKEMQVIPSLPPAQEDKP